MEDSSKASQHTEETVIAEIKSQIENNQVLLYMKGKPQAPECGFSATVVKALADCGTQFAFINILERQDIREYLPKYASWPTFPQLYIQGELIGGSDIISHMHKSGELQKKLASIKS